MWIAFVILAGILFTGQMVLYGMVFGADKELSFWISLGTTLSVAGVTGMRAIASGRG